MLKAHNARAHILLCVGRDAAAAASQQTAGKWPGRGAPMVATTSKGPGRRCRRATSREKEPTGKRDVCCGHQGGPTLLKARKG